MLSIMSSRGCKRCGGNLFLERDEYGVYISCMQCGAVCAEFAAQSTGHPAPRSGRGRQLKRNKRQEVR